MSWKDCAAYVGYLPLDRAEANAGFQFVTLRSECGSMIITSNRSFAEWVGVLGDHILAAAILDRVRRQSDVRSVKGPSCGLKDRLNLVDGGEPMPCSPHRDRHVRSYTDQHVRSYADARPPHFSRGSASTCPTPRCGSTRPMQSSLVTTRRPRSVSACYATTRGDPGA
ncbi:MAG: ATP-binding protein [Cellulomonas sp.]